MAQAEFSENDPHSTLSRSSIHHLLTVLADVTKATAVLFDEADEVVAGPTAGNVFIRRVLETVSGRQAVLAAHRSTIHPALPGQVSDANGLESTLDRFAIPMVRNDKTLGTLTLGDRPRRLVPAKVVRQIASLVNLPEGVLQEAAKELIPWGKAEVSAVRNLGALLVELLADLRLQDEDLRQRLDELGTVYNLAGLASGTMDLQEILNTTARMVCEVMQVKACSIRLLDEATGDLVIKAVHNLSNEYLNKGPVNINQNPIDQAARNGEMVRIADAPTDPRTRYPEQARREGIVSGLVCGMIYRGHVVGVLRVYTGEPHVFTLHEEALLRTVSSQAAAAIVNARLLHEAIEAERNARQIAYAGAVQRRMIPESAPKYVHLEIGALYRPTYEVGGDFYDLISLGDDRLGIVIADVSGKGVPASLLMASLRSLFRAYAGFTHDIGLILAETNAHMCRDTTVGEFATAFYGVLRPDSRQLTYSNAGHDPPMLLRKGTIQYLETGGMVLGVDRAATFEHATIELQAGDIVLLHTDGAVEATNFAEKQFGRNRLAESLMRYATEPAQRIVQNINWDLRRFRGLADRTDDLTLVVLKIT